MTLQELADDYAVAYSDFILNGDKESHKECLEREKALHLGIAAAISSALIDAAERFEGTLPFNWVCADGYVNGLDIGGELRYMAEECAK